MKANYMRNFIKVFRQNTYHILANTDVLRPNKIKEIETKFKRELVVIIHGHPAKERQLWLVVTFMIYFPRICGDSR